MERKHLAKIIDNIYKEMYKKATPSADWEEMVSSGEVGRKDFFLDYYLDEREQEKIIEKHLVGLSKMEKNAVRTSVYLGSSPTSVKGK